MAVPTFTEREPGMTLEQMAALLTAAGGGSVLTAITTKILGRRADRTDALQKLEEISSSLTARAVSHAEQRILEAEQRADERIGQAEAQVSELRDSLRAHQVRDAEREQRRHEATTEHVVWDHEVAQRLEDLGHPVGPPPALE